MRGAGAFDPGKLSPAHKVLEARLNKTAIPYGVVGEKVTGADKN